MQRRHKVLITGSSGMLGMDLCRELEGGFDIYGADIRPGQGSAVKEYLTCDITDEKNTAEVIAKIKPDIVVHTAAMTDVDGCELDKGRAYKVNGTGAKNVALACGKTNSVLVYISTDFVFDGKKREPYTEDDRPNPLGIYGESKLKGEEAVAKNSKKYFILRTSWLYGKHGKNFVDTIIAKSKTEKVLKVVNDQTGSPTYTRDLAKAIHSLLDGFFTQYPIPDTQYGIYHVSNSGSVSWYEYAKEILRLAGSGTKVEPISSQELSRPAKRPAMSVLDNSKFVELTGFNMRSWESPLGEYILEKKER